MKHLSYLLLVVLILTGCNIFDSDSGQTVVKDFDVVNVRIKFGEEFVYPLGSLGDEEQASIKEDSPNASVSELFYDFEESVLVKYGYQPTRILQETIQLCWK